jgi:hypothetical protein
MANFVFLLIGFIIGWLALRALVNYKMKIMLDSIANSPSPKREEHKKIDLDFMKKDHIIYCYNRDGDVFLASGSSKKEIMEVLSKKFPGTSFMANSANLKDVGLEAAE